MTRTSRRSDYSRLIMFDLSPTEAAILAGVLSDAKRKGRVKLGGPVYDLIEGAIDQIQRQLKQIGWPSVDFVPPLAADADAKSE